MAGRSEIAAGRAFVTLYLKARDFYGPLAAARASLLGFGRSVAAFGLIAKTVADQTHNLGQQVASLGKSMVLASASVATASAAIAGGLVTAVAHFANYGESLAKMSDRTGIGIRALSELGYAAEVAGTSVNELELGIKNMQNQIAAKDQFGLRGLPPEEQLSRLADHFQTLATAERRTAFAQDMFGKSGTKLLPLLSGGSAGIKSLREEATRFGRSISETDARNAERLKDAWQALVRAAYGLMFTIGGSFGESLIRTLRYMTELVTASGKWINENRQIVKALAAAAVGLAAFSGTLATVGAGLYLVGNAISVVASVVGSLAAVLGIAIPLIHLMVMFWPAISAAAASVAAFASGAFAAISSAGILATAMATLGTVASAIVSTVLTPLGLAVAAVVAGVVALTGAVVAGTAAAAAAAYAFWKLADPFAALAPLAKSVIASLQKIVGLLLAGDFEGAAIALVDGFREAMVQTVRAIFDMIKNTLERLPTFIARVLSGTGGFLTALGRIIRHAFMTMVPSMIASLRLFYELARDVFLQLPRIAAYSAGLIVREFAIAFTNLNVWLVQQLAASLMGLGRSLAGLGPRLLQGMLTGDITGIHRAMQGLLAASVIGSAASLSGFLGGIAGTAAPKFTLSPSTIAAYKNLLGELNRAGGGATPQSMSQQGQQQARSLSGSFVTYSATALAASGRGGAVERMAREGERRRMLAEKTLDEIRAHRKETKRMADGLRHG